MTAYYNEINPFAAAWLRNLIDAGEIAKGEVDERSIVDVRPEELAGFTQCHFFAGIGVWSHALKRSGWPDDRPVWTGSCPCQPFSSAGKKRGFADERHLWPTWFKLIKERRPIHLFGEQVASPDGLAWLDTVLSDLEEASYAARAFDICAAGVGAPHIRQRLWIVAYDESNRRDRVSSYQASGHSHGQPQRRGANRSMAISPRPQGRALYAERGDEVSSGSSSVGFWSNAEWLPCLDGKARPIEPGSFPLVDGAPGRVGRLRAYGNAIVAPVAVELISGFLAAESEAA